MARNRGNEVLKTSFPKLPTLSKRLLWLARNHGLKVTENQHIIATGGRPEEAGDIMSGHDVKSMQCYQLGNF